MTNTNVADMSTAELRRQTAVVESVNAEHDDPLDVIDWNVYRSMLSELNTRD